ncbi:MAG: glycosyltransferase family 2 protein [Anaerolineaceae bacterium]|nr:glycosyltransferase family 2 protein [Anaerolineaceae bacterium]
MKPAIVVVAYNRPEALRRLLASLAALQGAVDVPLVISVDAGGLQQDQVMAVAQQFAWAFGEKRVVVRERPYGLINHVFACGDLVDEFGAIILLEDDLVVSPMAYRFAADALTFYADDPQIAGISLNTLWFHGITHEPFTPYLDDGDVFFMQIAWFQGQAYTRQQWARFREWRAAANTAVLPTDPMHELFQTFPSTDWFPLKTKYLMQTNRFYVFPRESLSSNFGDTGTHVRGTSFFQVPLQTRRASFRFQPLAESVAVYDSFQEMLPERVNRLTDRFAAFDYTVDLHGTRSPANIPSEFVLTTQELKHPLAAFGLERRPLLDNIIHQQPGTGIFFGRSADLDLSWRARLRAESRRHAYFARRQVGIRQRLKWWLGKILSN